MRIKHAIFAGIMAALALQTAPAPAKNSEAKTPGESTPSSSCSALQQTADGSWARSPCQELGPPQQPPPKSAARTQDQQTR